MVLGSTFNNPLLIDSIEDLFDAGVLKHADHKGNGCPILVCTSEKDFILRLLSTPVKCWAKGNQYTTFALLAYKKHAGNIEAGLKNTGYTLDNE